MEKVLNNGFYEMSQEEVMLLDGGNWFDDMVEGFFEAFGCDNVTVSEAAHATGQLAGDIAKGISRIFPWNW